MRHQVTANDLGRGEVLRHVTEFAKVDAVLRAEAFATVLPCNSVSGPMVWADRLLAIWQINPQDTARVLEAAWRAAVRGLFNL